MKIPRSGFALPAVLALLVLVIPVVFAFSLRSRAAMDWYVKLEDQKRAMLLATEGEVRVRESLRQGGAVKTGSRRDGAAAMEWRLVDQPPGDAGQTVSALIGEGVSQGEERMLLAFVETFGTGAGAILLERDRAFVPPGAAGGTLTDPTALVADHQRAIAGYVRILATENATTPAEFVRRLQDQSRRLASPDITRDWTEIAQALAQAKCTVP